MPEDVRVSSQVPSICGEIEQRDIETLKQSKVCSFSAPGSVCGDEEYVYKTRMYSKFSISSRLEEEE